MLRFYFVVATSFFRMLYYVLVAIHYTKHRERYDEAACYRHAQKMMNHLRRRARTTTLVYGTENLPSEGGYILFSNHQGKYDALGIMIYHEAPCGVLIELKSSNVFSTKQVVDMTQSIRIDQGKPRQQLAALRKLGEEVRAGRRFLVFPEGKYEKNGNNLQEFHDGCFYSAYIARCPVVPVALVDSAKSMNTNKPGRVTTQIHFLKPIPYEEYRNLSREELCAEVKSKIRSKLDEVLTARGEAPVVDLSASLPTTEKTGK